MPPTVTVACYPSVLHSQGRVIVQVAELAEHQDSVHENSPGQSDVVQVEYKHLCDTVLDFCRSCEIEGQRCRLCIGKGFDIPGQPL